MALIRRQIEVESEPALTRELWRHFIDWILTGGAKLACDEFVCVDPGHGSAVSFECTDAGTTRVVLALDDESGPSGEILKQRIDHDLVLFKHYVERGGHGLGRPTAAERYAIAGQDGRRERRAPRRHASTEQEAVSFQDHFPT